MRTQKEVLAKMLKSMLSIIILKMLQEKPMHGYAFINEIRRHFGVYFGPSTIYPLLTAMERKGYLKSHWSMDGEKPRKVYEITDSGKALLEESCTELRVIIKPLVLVSA